MATALRPSVSPVYPLPGHGDFLRYQTADSPINSNQTQERWQNYPQAHPSADFANNGEFAVQGMPQPSGFLPPFNHPASDHYDFEEFSDEEEQAPSRLSLSHSRSESWPVANPFGRTEYAASISPHQVNAMAQPRRVKQSSPLKQERLGRSHLRASRADSPYRPPSSPSKLQRDRWSPSPMAISARNYDYGSPSSSKNRFADDLGAILTTKAHLSPKISQRGLGQSMTGRQFQCDECIQSFNRNHDLKRHKRIHLIIKPFPCGWCEKSFSRKDALKRHLLVKTCGRGLGQTAEAAEAGMSCAPAAIAYHQSVAEAKERGDAESPVLSPLSPESLPNSPVAGLAAIVPASLTPAKVKRKSKAKAMLEPPPFLDSPSTSSGSTTTVSSQQSGMSRTSNSVACESTASSFGDYAPLDFSEFQYGTSKSSLPPPSQRFTEQPTFQTDAYTETYAESEGSRCASPIPYPPFLSAAPSIEQPSEIQWGPQSTDWMGARYEQSDPFLSSGGHAPAFYAYTDAALPASFSAHEQRTQSTPMHWSTPAKVARPNWEPSSATPPSRMLTSQNEAHPQIVSYDPGDQFHSYVEY